MEFLEGKSLGVVISDFSHEFIIIFHAKIPRRLLKLHLVSELSSIGKAPYFATFPTFVITSEQNVVS